MSINHEQKAAIGTSFLAEIDRRIAIRSASKAKIGESVSLDGRVAVEAAEKDIAAMGFRLGKARVTGMSTCSYGDRAHCNFKLLGGMRLENVPIASLSHLSVVIAENGKIEKRRAAICAELEFLHGLKGGSVVGAFQAYVARLWAPKDKDDVLGSRQMVSHFDAFADGRRGFTCSL